MANTPPTHPDQTDGNYLAFLLAGAEHTGSNGSPVNWAINVALLPLYIANDTDTNGILETAVALGVTFPLTFVGIGLELAFGAVEDSGSTTGPLITNLMQTDLNPLVEYAVLIGVTTPLTIAVIPVVIALDLISDLGPTLKPILETDPYEYLAMAIELGVVTPLEIALPVVEDALGAYQNSGKTLNGYYKTAEGFLITQEELNQSYDALYEDLEFVATSYIELASSFAPSQSEIDSFIETNVDGAVATYQEYMGLVSETLNGQMGLVPSQEDLNVLIESSITEISAIQEDLNSSMASLTPSLEDIGQYQEESENSIEAFLEEVNRTVAQTDFEAFLRNSIENNGIDPEGSVFVIGEYLAELQSIDVLPSGQIDQADLERRIREIKESYEEQFAEIEEGLNMPEPSEPQPQDPAEDAQEFAAIVLDQIQDQDINVEELVDSDLIQYAADSQIGFVSEGGAVVVDQGTFLARYIDQLTPVLSEPAFELINETPLAEFFTPEEAEPVFATMFDA